jgi:MtN3 and saliva related transmembrane protein
MIRAMRTRSMRDVSPWMLVCYAIGIALWLWYGIITGALPVIVWNAASLALYLVLIVLRVIHR